MKPRATLKTNKGFTLVEVLVTAGIIAMVIVVLLQLLVYCSLLSENATNLMVALSEAQGKLEEIRNHDYDSIAADYGSGGSPGNTFDLSQIDGKGVIYVDASNASLLQVRVVVAWRNRNGRIVGEDADLDGVLDAAEDRNGSGELDSPATLASLIAEK